MVGVYGFHQTIDTSGLQEQGPLASLWLLSGANQNDPSILNGLRSANDIGLQNTSVATFGQLTWHRQAEPAARWMNYDKKDGRYIATVTNRARIPR